MQYTEKELSELIKSVEKEFTVYLNKPEATASLVKSEDASSAAPLVKAEEKPADEKEEKPADEKKPEQEEKKDEKKEDAPPSDEKKPDAEAKPEEKPAPEAHSDEKPEASAEHAHSEDGCDYDEQDLDHMHKMYASMSRGELKAHHDSVRNALDGHMAKSGDMNMAKSEETVVTINPETIKPNEEVTLLKSEIEAQKAKSEGLQKTLDTLQAFLTKLVSVKAAPQGKAITSMEQITKSEGFSEEKQLTKNEINEVLLKKSSDPQLAKTDREAINAFYLNGASINTISHLLK